MRGRLYHWGLAVCAAAVLAWVAPARGAETQQEPSVDLRGSEIQIFIENDVWHGTDQYYTNGIKIGGGVPAEHLLKLLSVPPSALLDAITAGASNHLGFFVGQNLYTPRDITISAPQPFDRPWAAWLYLGGVAQSAKDGRLHTVEFDLGLVGPPALGEEVQTFWHRLVDAPKPQGWDNQVKAEPGFLVSYLHKRRFGDRSGVQIVPHAGASIGTIMTFARAGAIVRLGQHMTGFGPDGIEPGGAMLKNTRLEGEHGGRDPYEWFIFAGADGRLVAHNIFVDGSLFRGGPGVDGRDFVYDFMAGLSARIDKFRLSVTRVKRSEEFTTPQGGGGSQRFYSINLGIEF